MSNSNFSIEEHFPDMWDAIMHDWLVDSSSTNPDPDLPVISPKQRSLLRKVRPVGLMGRIVVLETPNKWTKESIEKDLIDPIKHVLKTRLDLSVSLAITSTNGDPDADSAGNTHEGASQTGSVATADDLSMSQVEELVNKAEHKDGMAQAGGSATAETAEEAARQREHDADELAGQYAASENRIDPNPSPAPTRWTNKEPAHRPAPRHAPSPQPSSSFNDGLDGESLLNKNYTFENFVVGSSNNFAAAACRAVAEAPAKAYNPLFIWGESGLGKTHLLHAIGHYAKELQPNMRVKYVSSEELTNDFINSIANDTRESFKRRYRNLDMLIVDDIQFLQNKESTQEEFFHTFNALHQANKQIVLSSDRPPRQLTTLEDRLRTRFEGGLITDVQTPDLETRIAILTKKAESDNVQLPEDVKVLIASRYEKSIRELDGALIRVTAYCALSHEPLTVETAEIALRDISPADQDVEIVPQHVIEVVANYFNLTTDELVGKGRAKKFVQARQIAMYLCRELTDLSLPKLGSAFGGRDHTTVMYAERRVRESLSENKKVFDQVQELTQKIKSHARD
ncbi:chromosomal replication initiator protein DnaA [uncultured Corynebacterium sp.]|uniref:chromosomal replication initiator protein DnaA n=1 Tax=uncultured Corynebacterium sp. TaxID=159447 RepID=UPI0025EC2570|nr:chromosomal replication initiator protein DnaA [uncultured Corynebacterium sp.]